MPDAADRDASTDPAAARSAPPACAIDPDTECPVCAARGVRVKMQPVKAHYQCPECRYFDSCCM
jgi:transposase-like protein